MRNLRSAFVSFVVLTSLAALPAHADKVDSKPNLAAFGAGALVVNEVPSYGGEQYSPLWILDEDPTTGYASPQDDVAPKQIVIELADRDAISEVAFDTAKADSPEVAAKDVKVEIADKASGPWQPLVTAVLAGAKNDQHFVAKAPKTGRYLKVSLLDNHGGKESLQLEGFAAYGKVVHTLPVPDHSGTFDSSQSRFHIKITGTTAVGCYEVNHGLIENGGFDGRVLRFTWAETDDSGKRTGGPAVMVFPDDGKSFVGLYWEGTSKTAGQWDGKRSDKGVGTCPHYKFESKPGGELAEQLRKEGRARLYGITFDTDSDHIKGESKATLDQLVAAAKAEPSWKLNIEGHTDSTGTADHNQSLSDKRAAAVKAYLVKAGIAANRLTTKGFGATKPVSSNETSLGRSQNRRVEIVKT